jgi:hypothetical protein
LGIPHCLCRLFFCVLVNRRDGFHVSRIIWQNDHVLVFY